MQTLDFLNLLSRFIEPRSKDEDSRREEFIFNILISGAIVLSAVALISSLITFSTKGREGIPIILMLVLLGIFVGLYIMSRKGLHRAAAYLPLVFYFVPTTYALVRWGVELPQSLLTYALIIVMSGVLISTRFAWIATCVIVFILVSFSMLEGAGYLIFDDSWKKMPVLPGDVIVFSFTLFNILVVSWLSNREIEKSLLRARLSDKALKKEKDTIEEKVEKRARELERAQEERIAQLSRFAEFGRKTGAVIHDLLNPLAAITLSLKRLEVLDEKNVKIATEDLELAIRATEGMRDYVDIIKYELSEADAQVDFDVDREVLRAIEIVSVKAEERNVRITYDGPKSVAYIGGPVKFRHAVSNLISNAIDVYDEFTQDARREVLISLRETEKEIRLSVMDWGMGIGKKDLGNILKPFYTTKTSKQNLGIGLSIVTDVIEVDFSGTLEVDSEEGRGTTFTIKLPVEKTEKKESKVNA